MIIPEKPARKSHDWLEVSSTCLRVVQWMSACFIYTTVCLGLSHVIYTGEDINRVRAIKPLVRHSSNATYSDYRIDRYR
jgi:hypothetical protein